MECLEVDCYRMFPLSFRMAFLINLGHLEIFLGVQDSSRLFTMMEWIYHIQLYFKPMMMVI